MDPINDSPQIPRFSSLTSIKNIASMLGGRFWRMCVGGKLESRINKIYTSLEHATQVLETPKKRSFARFFANLEMYFTKASWSVAAKKIAHLVYASKFIESSPNEERFAIYKDEIGSDEMLEKIETIDVVIVQSINGPQINPESNEHRNVGKTGVVSNRPADSHDQSSQDMADIIDEKEFAVLLGGDGVSIGGGMFENEQNIGASGALSALLKKAILKKVKDPKYLKILQELNDTGSVTIKEYNGVFNPLLKEMAANSLTVPFLGGMNQGGDSFHLNNCREATTCTLAYVDKAAKEVKGVLLGDSSVFVLNRTPTGDLSCNQHIGAKTGSMSLVGGMIESGLPGEEGDWKIHNQEGYFPQKFSEKLSDQSLILTVTDGLTDNILNPKVLEHIIMGTGFDTEPDHELQMHELSPHPDLDYLLLPIEDVVERVAGDKSANVPSAVEAEIRIRNYIAWLKTTHTRLNPLNSNFLFRKDDDLAMAIYQFIEGNSGPSR